MIQNDHFVKQKQVYFINRSVNCFIYKKNCPHYLEFYSWQFWFRNERM